MVRWARLLLLAVVVGTAATRARAQAPALPAVPVPVPPRESAAPDVLPLLPAPGRVLPAAPPTPTFAPAPLPGPYFERDPLLDRPPLPQPGWFADVDLGVVIPHVKNHLTGQVQVPGTGSPDTVMLGSAPLDWTVFPRIEAGYRLPSGFGAFSLSYRFLAADGTGTARGMDGPAVLKSRLGLNEVGLDYTSAETSLWPHWDMKWSVGVRLLYVFFDSRADESPDLAAAGSTIFEQRESNWYAGFGPHVGLELDRQIDGTGLSFVVRGDGAIYLGRLRQGFFEQSTALGPNGVPLGGEMTTPVSQAVPALGVFVGLRWQPPRWQGANLYLGYQYEHWWDVGKNNSTLSSGELNVQGIFLRAEWNF